MTKHSSGPWRQVDCFAAPFRVETSEGYDVASCEYPADARLIAAAPELLELLRGIRRHLAEAAERKQDFDWLIAHACVQGDIDPLIRRIEGDSHQPDRLPSKQHAGDE